MRDAERIEDRLADFTRDRRLLVLSGMALVVGLASAGVAYALVWLIGLITYPDELLSDAVAHMLRHGVGRLPVVVSRQDPTRLLGYLGRAEVIAARRRLLEEEDVRERSWRVWATAAADKP